MNKLAIFCVFVSVIAVSVAQWNNQQPPFNPGFQQPNINDLCAQPGANCNVQSRFAEESSFTDHRGNSNRFTRVCDDRGCFERRLQNGASSSQTMNFMLMLSIVAVVAGIKNLIH